MVSTSSLYAIWPRTLRPPTWPVGLEQVHFRIGLNQNVWRALLHRICSISGSVPITYIAGGPTGFFMNEESDRLQNSC